MFSSCLPDFSASACIVSELLSMGLPITLTRSRKVAISCSFRLPQEKRIAFPEVPQWFSTLDILNQNKRWDLTPDKLGKHFMWWRGLFNCSMYYDHTVSFNNVAEGEIKTKVRKAMNVYFGLHQTVLEASLLTVVWSTEHLNYDELLLRIFF